MKMRKMAAAALAAVLAVSAPLAGAASNALSVTASASETEVKTEGDWMYIVNEDGKTVSITKYNGTDTEIEFPATLDGKPVITIVAMEINGRNSPVIDAAATSSVKIPDSVTTIGHHAFMDCTSLTSVTIPNSVTEIGFNAFSGCKSLESVTIPERVTIIRYGAFGGCKSLESVTIPGSATEIAEVVFSGCSSLKSVTILNGLEAISDGLFSGCTSLETITLPQSIKGIYDGAFRDCTSLKNVIFNGTKEEWDEVYIVDNCLEYFQNASITFNDSVESEPTPSTGVPGDTDKTSDTEGKQETIAATLKGVDSKEGLSGAALEKQIFGDSGWTWGQAEKIEFASDKLFSVQYTAADGSTKTLGEETAARAEDDGIWNTAWTLDTSLMSKEKPFVKLIAKDGTADITAKVYIKMNAEKPSNSDQKPTGIALAIAPVVLAAGAVIVISKKRK